MATPCSLVPHKMQSTVMAVEGVWEYVKMQSGDDSLWESFPHALETLECVRRYISAFQAPLQELTTPSPQQIYTLQACSPLVIPPPTERTPPQRGFLTDLAELNLLGWAALVQDVVASGGPHR